MLISHSLNSIMRSPKLLRLILITALSFLAVAQSSSQNSETK